MNKHELLETLESIAFDISSGVERREIHKKIIHCIQYISSSSDNATKSEDVTDEVKKVARRLKLWVNKPQQINYKFLMTYLTLIQNGFAGKITIDMLRDHVSTKTSVEFDRNFAQMKNISDKNHGKIFEVHNGFVEIWPPVISYVKLFERDIWGDQLPSVF